MSTVTSAPAAVERSFLLALLQWAVRTALSTLVLAPAVLASVPAVAHFLPSGVWLLAGVISVVVCGGLAVTGVYRAWRLRQRGAQADYDAVFIIGGEEVRVSFVDGLLVAGVVAMASAIAFLGDFVITSIRAPHVDWAGHLFDAACMGALIIGGGLLLLAATAEFILSLRRAE